MKTTRFLISTLSLVALFLSGIACPLNADSLTAERERAAATLEQAVKTDPNNSELWLHLGFAYRKSEQMDKAQAAFEKAANLNPHSSDAFYMLGLIYESKHQNAEAQKAWQSYMATETDSNKRTVAEKHIHHLNQ